MLIGLDEDRKVIWWHETITREQAEQYIKNGAVWTEGIEISPPFEEGKTTEIYLNEDNTVRYEFKEPEQDPELQPEPTNREIMAEIVDLKTTAVQNAIDDYTMELIEGGLIV